MLKRRQFYFLMALISLFFLISMIQDTYAKYRSAATATGNFTIAKWGFKVNSQDIIANADFSNTINPVINSNSNVKANVIAPTSTGYFDIVIDSSDVDVSYTETLTFTNGENNTLTDLVIYGYSLNGSDMISLDGTNTITNNHLLTDSKSNTYRIYIKWLDGNNETMNNTQDTEATVSGIANVKADINFIQKA